MLKKLRLPLLVLSILVLNGLIYLRAYYTISESELVFAECARNSGRTAAALNLIILLMLGYYGLKSIYQKAPKKNLLLTLLTLFAVNHLMHFYFVYQNFINQDVVLDASQNLHGVITFVLIMVVPLIFWMNKRLNVLLYWGLIVHLINVTYFIAHTFYGRYNAEDQAYLHRIGILIMMAAVIYMLYGAFRERSISYRTH